jgi:RNA polymerase sigma-70 factor (ECF subfamily)
MAKTIAPKLRLVYGPVPPSVPAPERASEDLHLIAALRAGDAACASVLHDRVRPRIEKTVRRLLGGRDPDQEDIVQQALIELVSSIDRYRGDAPIESWASAIAAHAVYNHIRRRKLERRIFRALSKAMLDRAASPVRVGREGFVHSALSRVLVHLDAMDENKAWTFFLHDVWGYDLREVADIMGVSASAAQTRLVRGRQELTQRIAGDGELENVLQVMEREP